MTTLSTLRSNLVGLLAAALGAGACAPASRPLASTPNHSRPCASTSVTTASELQAAAQCHTIRGDLRIEGSKLTSLEGLERLQTVTGSLRISGNPELEDLSGLSGLRSVRTLVVNDNRTLDSLDGLDGLRSLETLVLTNNGIYTTQGLGGLASVGSLVVANNARLISLGGLGNLKAAGNLTIVSNPRVAFAMGFLNELAAVPGGVRIERNAGLSRSEVNGVVERLQQDAARVAAR